MKRIIEATIILTLCFIGVNSQARELSYGAKLCKEGRYHCITVKQGQTWQSLWQYPEDRELVARLNRMNVRLQPGMRLAVPDDLENMDIWDISPFPSTISPPGEKLIIYDPGHLAWAAYEPNGDIAYWGPGASGQAWCSDINRGCRTVTGTFRMHRKEGSRCISNKYPLPNGGAPMPYCMFFHRGYGFHGSNQVPGYHASHGCIRTFSNDAEWLNTEFIELPNSGNKYKGTKVIVRNYPG